MVGQEKSEREVNPIAPGYRNMRVVALACIPRRLIEIS